MKKTGKYYINPAPFAMIVANSPGSKRKAKRRNPAKKKSKGPGIFVIRKAKRNPIKRGPSMPTMKTKRRRKAKRRNPISNLGRFAKRKTRRAVRKIRRKAKRSASIFSRNPMSTKKRRRRGSRRRTRNPISRRGATRRRSGRRSSRRMRNPLPIVKEMFGPDMITFAGGIVVANVGTTMIMNRILAGDPTTGQRSFDLPLVDYSMLGTANAQTFYSKNAWVLAAYKLAIAGAAGWALKSQSPRLSRGIMVGGVATAISDVLRNANILNAQGTLSMARAGTGRGARAFLGRGAGTYIPGVPPLLSGPGTAFINNGAPMARNGMGAAVNSRWANATAAGVPDPFKTN